MTYIIAEIGNTHEGSIGLAKQFIKVAARCGADAVKIQTHIFEAESLISAPNPHYFKDESRKDYFDRTSFTLKELLILKKFAEDVCSVDFLSSPFSIEAVDLLEEVDIQRYKIPSGEVSNIPLLERIAETKKPIILSSGMSPWDDLDTAVNFLKDMGCNDITLLQCSSIYPCPPECVGLNLLNQLSVRYQIPVGYSDHTLGVAAPLAAVALGASIIEKHFTLSQEMYGSDAKHSMEPVEFKQMVDDIRDISVMLRNPVDKDDISKNLLSMKHTFEKSIVAKLKINQGDIFTRKNLTLKKPGNGLPPKFFHQILGMKASNDIEKDEMLTKDSYS